MSAVTERVKQYIERRVGLTPDSRLLVALSGGADSVALLRILLALGYRLEAAHCNFRLRGAESERDEQFVTDLCRQLGVRLHVTRFDTRAVAAGRHISIEMAARDLRYAYFEKLRFDCRLTDIAVAHHADDSVETLLLNLIRGTGIDGLRGIQPRVGHIVRPLLCLCRAEIEDYLRSVGQPFVTDSTNLHDDYTRNKVRLKLLPLLREINPSVSRSMLNTAHHLTDVATIYNKYIDEARRRVVDADQRISIAGLLREPAPEALLYEILSPLGFNAARVDDLMRSLDGQPGKVFESVGWRAVKDREYILLSRREAVAPPAGLSFEVREVGPGFKPSRSADVATLDADRLTLPLTVRTYRQGDWFVPFGMRGRKNLSDYLTDLKLPLTEKAAQQVVCSGNDIVWVVGRRTDNRFRVTDSTRRVMIIRVGGDGSSSSEG